MLMAIYARYLWPSQQGVVNVSLYNVLSLVVLAGQIPQHMLEKMALCVVDSAELLIEYFSPIFFRHPVYFETL